MMRQTGLLRWNNKHNSKGGGRQWIHPPDALQRGHIVYLVKFLGNTEVEQAKGVEVVKEGIRKLKFSQQLRKSEGAKTPKVELTISADGVTIQDPKSKRIVHQYPLHRISYCADDKADKKFFSFIAKEAEAEKHTCFVFVSDKLAEEITLTIGQAFDLAYRRFLETSGRDMAMRKQLMLLQKKVQELETENTTLRQRVAELQLLKDRQDVDQYKHDNNLNDLLMLNGDLSPPPAKAPYLPSSPVGQQVQSPVKLSPPPSTTNGVHAQIPPPPVPLRAFEKKDSLISPSQELFEALGPAMTVPVVGPRLENLVLDDLEDFDPRQENNNFLNGNKPLVNGSTAPPVTNGNMSPDHGKDLFGADPFTAVATPPQSPAEADPFGMGDFNPDSEAKDLEQAIGALDKKINEMRDGFRRGLSFGNDDFPLEDLDPLVNKPT